MEDLRTLMPKKAKEELAKEVSKVIIEDCKKYFRYSNHLPEKIFTNCLFTIQKKFPYIEESPILNKMLWDSIKAVREDLKFQDVLYKLWVESNRDNS